jgi:thiol-disulfide isomerase/thioredoxin
MVVNIWGSWCDPCQAEAPYLEHANEAYRDKGVQFVGIDTRDNDGQAKAFVKAKNISYPNLVDDGNETLLSKLAGITSLGSVPSTLIIDRDGKLAWRALLPVDYTTVSAALDTVLSGK